MSIYDAAMAYANDNTPLVVIGGKDYGMGSSRDWAAKGTLMLGVKVVIAESFERIHRSNLVGMGVLPLEFIGNTSKDALNLNGTETLSFGDLTNIKPGSRITVIIQRDGALYEKIDLLVRLDTDLEVNYFKNGGLLPYVLRNKK